MNIGTKREYRMTARAAATEATGERIIDAAVEVFAESFDLPLREVAARAGVSEQTVIRRFGGKEQLLEAASQREAARIAAQRDAAPIGDLAGAISVLVDHYEEHGDLVIRMLANEDRFDALAKIVDGGRHLHEEWCVRVFADWLDACDPEDRDRLLAQLIAVTDVYTWKLLRRDRRLDRNKTELAMRELAASLTGGA